MIQTLLSKDYESNKEFYKENKVFKEYVDRYVKHNSIDLDTAFKHAIISLYRQHIMKGGN